MQKIKLLRIGNFPTELHRTTGFHAYKLNFSDALKVFQISDKLEGNPLPLPDGMELKRTKLHWRKRTDRASVDMVTRFIFRLIGAIWFNFKCIYFSIGKQLEAVHLHSPIYILVGLFWKIFGKKIYITYHGADYHRILNSKLYSMVSCIFNGVFTLSPDQLDGLQKKHRCKVVLVKNGVDMAVYEDRGLDREKIILNVAAFKDQKNQNKILEAFSLSKIFKDGYRLVFVGDGELKQEAMLYCEELNIKEHVDFKGRLQAELVIEEYNKAEVFILASKWEGNAKVLLEAMSCGCKILTTKVDSAEAILGEDYPYYIPVSDEVKMSDGIIKIIEEKSYQFEKIKQICTLNQWDGIDVPYKKIYLND